MKNTPISELEQGDLVIVRWLDASEMRTKLSEHQQSPEIHVKDIGVFLGIGGAKKQHLILGKDVVERYNDWGAVRIPCELIVEIQLLIPRSTLLQSLEEIQHLVRRFTPRRYSRVRP